MRRLGAAVEGGLARLDQGVTGWMVFALILGLSIGARAYRTRHGIFVSHDGLAYLAEARAFSLGNLALDPGGAGGRGLPVAPLHYAPLYPAVLALIGHLPVIDLEGAALVVNTLSAVALGLGLRALVGELWEGEEAGAGAWRILIVVVALLSAPQVLLRSFVVSEPAFFAVYVWFTVVAIRYDRRSTATRFAALAALGCALVALRWAGAFLVIGLAAYLALRALRDRRAPLASAVLGAISVGAVGAWALWVGTFDRPPSMVGHDQDGTLPVLTSGAESVAAFGLRILGVLEGRVGGARGRGSVPLPSPVSGLAFAAGVLVGAAVVAVAVSAVVRLWGRQDAVSGALAVVAVPALVYGVLMLATRAYLGYYVILRYWGILAVVVLAAATRALVLTRSRTRPAVVLLGVALAVVNLVGLAGLVVKARAIEHRPRVDATSDDAAAVAPASRRGSSDSS